MSPLGRPALLLATAALVVGLVPAAHAGDNPLGNATGGGSDDPVGDVQVTSGQVVLTPEEINSIDVTRMVWKVINRRYVSIKLHLVDLQPAGAHRPFYGATAHAGRKTVFLAARQKGVVIVDDDGSKKCRGSRTRIDEQADLVRLQVPVRCLPATRYDFAPITLLEDANGGTDLASDEVRRTGKVKIR